MEKDKKSLIIILVLIALVLGFLIIKRDNKGIVSSTPDNNSVQANNQNDDRTVIFDRTFPDSLSNDEKSVLVVPFDGSDEEKQAHFELADSLAVSGNRIDIAGCFGDPLVLRISEQSDLRITNSDNEGHTLLLGDNVSILVGPGETETLSGVFDRGLGLYGYGCDLEAGTTGLFMVTE